MSLTTALLLKQPINFPVGAQRVHYMDNRSANVPAAASAQKRKSIDLVAKAIANDFKNRDEIGEATGLSKSTVVSAVNMLIDAGLVDVDARKGRRGISIRYFYKMFQSTPVTGRNSLEEVTPLPGSIIPLKGEVSSQSLFLMKDES